MICWRNIPSIFAYTMSRLSLGIIFFLHIHVTTTIKDNVLMPGDAVLGGLLEVTSTGQCIQIIPESIETHEAVRWFYRMLNERNYIPGVTLGYHAYQTCGQPSRATQQTLNILNKYSDTQGPYLIGLLGPERSSETQPVSRLLSSLPVNDRLPQISFSATASSLSDKNVYKNLFRVIQADDVQVKVIVGLMEKLDWNYVGVIYENDTYGRGAAESLKTQAEEIGICIPVFSGMSPEATLTQRNIVFTSVLNQLQTTSGSPVLGILFFGQGSTAKDMFNFLSNELDLERFQLIASESLALDQVYVQDNLGNIYSRAKGLLTPSSPYYDVALFRQYWEDLHTNGSFMLQQLQNNDWLLQYMKQVTGCSLTNSSSVDDACLEIATKFITPNNRLPMYIHYALVGAATFAKALKDLHQRACGSTSGLCSVLRGLPNVNVSDTVKSMRVSAAEFETELPNFNLSFRFRNSTIQYDGSDMLSTYDVYNFQRCVSTFCFVKVGSYMDSELSIEKNSIESFDKDGTLTEVVQAQCQPPFRCDICTASGRYGEVFFIPGDYYIVGLVPIHNKKPNSLDCGDLRNSTLSVDIAEAAHYAINSINGIFSQLFGNTTFGLILIDTCAHPYITQERVIHLNSGDLKLTKDINSSHILKKIIGYVGPAHSSVSVPLSSVMNEIQKVYISYSATSSTLSDRQRFPYFMRASAPDHRQANVIMEMAKMMDSKYVQIIFSDEEYGTAGRDALLKVAKEREICVAQSVAVPDTTDVRAFQGYISEIRRYRHAKVLILFLLPHMFPGFLSTLNRDINDDEFVFIGGEGWAQRDELLLYEGNTNYKLRGSLTITQKLPNNIEFEEYYKSITIENSQNPWLQDYIEESAKCFFPKSFNKLYNKACTPALISQHLRIDDWVPFTINTVYAMALGFHSAVSAICGGVTLCHQYSSENLIEYLKKVHLDIYNNNRSLPIFDDNGEGSVGYTISQIVSIGGNLEYTKVGISSKTGISLSVPLQNLKKTDFTSACENEVECTRCQKQFNIREQQNISTNANTESIEIGGPVFIGLMSAGGVLFVTVLVLTVCLVLRCKKSPTVEENPYLTVVPDSQKRDSNYDTLNDPRLSTQ